MIPNYIRKIISGQNNYLGKVISHKMKETEMGYRGSKSSSLLDSCPCEGKSPFGGKQGVKEQRVDGSWLLKNIAVPVRSLRCTLMGFERNYQVKIPAKQLNNRRYSILSNQPLLNPWFITGFADAESSFIISIYKTPEGRKI